LPCLRSLECSEQKSNMLFNERRELNIPAFM
jgi:hypothetical protein